MDKSVFQSVSHRQSCGLQDLGIPTDEEAGRPEKTRQETRDTTRRMFWDAGLPELAMIYCREP